MTRIKQLLLLGGAFEIVLLALSLFSNPIIGLINLLLFMIFLITALVFLFKHKVESVHRFAESHPEVAAFLYALGWLPYFAIPYIVITGVIIAKIALANNTEYIYTPAHPELLQAYLTFHTNVLYWGSRLSLLLAIIYVCRYWYLASKRGASATKQTEDKPLAVQTKSTKKQPAKAKKAVKTEKAKPATHKKVAHKKTTHMAKANTNVKK